MRPSSAALSSPTSAPASRSTSSTNLMRSSSPPPRPAESASGRDLHLGRGRGRGRGTGPVPSAHQRLDVGQAGDRRPSALLGPPPEGLHAGVVVVGQRPHLL